MKHIQVNQAMKQRRRTYRAHGRVNRARPSEKPLPCVPDLERTPDAPRPRAAYMSSPCHVEVILEEKSAPVAKEARGSDTHARMRAKHASAHALPHRPYTPRDCGA